LRTVPEEQEPNGSRSSPCLFSRAAALLVLVVLSVSVSVVYIVVVIVVLPVLLVLPFNVRYVLLLFLAHTIHTSAPLFFSGYPKIYIMPR
jgi:hypothetical protein